MPVYVLGAGIDDLIVSLPALIYYDPMMEGGRKRKISVSRLHLVTARSFSFRLRRLKLK